MQSKVVTGLEGITHGTGGRECGEGVICDDLLGNGWPN